MTNIAICDDDPIFLQNFCQQVVKATEQANVKIHLFLNSSEFLDLFHEKQSQFDAVFLDILMPVYSGIEAAEQIRVVDTYIPIVFISNTEDYWKKGYDLSVMQYLLKPVSETELQITLDRVLAAAQKRRARLLYIRTKAYQVVLSLDDIYYFESRDDKLIAHTAEASYEFYGTLRELEKRLVKQGFFRTSASYLINLDQFKYRKEYDIFLKNGASVRLSRNLVRDFLDAVPNRFREVHPNQFFTI